MKTVPVLKTGDKAYFDTFAGMIPCKVLQITRVNSIFTDDRPSTNLVVDLKLTRSRGAYKAGEVLRRYSLDVTPRQCKKVPKFGSISITRYTVQEDY